MENSNKRTIIITLLFGLVSSLLTYLMFHSVQGYKKEAAEAKVAVKALQNQVSVIQYNYKTEILYWQQIEDSLKEVIAQTNLALNGSKQKTSSLQRQIKTLISQGDDLNDSTAIIENCDSLKKETLEFIAASNTMDSLCTGEIAELKIQIQDKDSAFATCQNGFFAMKLVLDSSLAQQISLSNKLNQADKQIRKANLKSKLLATGVMILSGATAILLLQK